jgi:hypothetical protein
LFIMTLYLTYGFIAAKKVLIPIFPSNYFLN